MAQKQIKILIFARKYFYTNESVEFQPVIMPKFPENAIAEIGLERFK